MEEHTVAVIPEAEVLDEAYNLGYQRFEDAETIEEEDGNPYEAVSGFREYATWANNVAPRLRSLAGFVDSGPGTYTVGRKVVVVPEGNEDDLPADGKQMDIQYVHEAVLDVWELGAVDALEGNDHGENALVVSIT